MKQAIFLFLFILLNLSPVQSQEFFPASWNPGDTTSIFGDKINVRSQPSTDAGSTVQLVAGERVIIEGVQEKTTTLNGISMPWYKVKVLKNGSSGYVWGGLLSLLIFSESGDVQFVAGITKMTAKPGDEIREYQVEMRAIRANAVIGKVNATFKNAGHFYNSLFEPGARGLKGYNALLSLSIGFEACGYPWDDWYVLWDGKQMQSLPICTSISDASIFSHAESYVFPQGATEFIPGHGGPEDKLYYSVEHHEREDMEDDKGWNESSWARARPMRWDGKQWIRPKDMNLPKD